MIRQISSSANPQFKVWRSLLSSKGLKSEGQFLLSGEKLIREFLKNSGAKSFNKTNPSSVNFEIAAELIMLGHRPLQMSAPVYELSKELFNELDVIGTHFNLLVLKAPPLETSKPQDPVMGFEVIAPVGDPGNLGALIRSCVAFGVSKIHLTRESAHPFHPKCVKASAGAVLKAHLSQSGPVADWDHESVMALDADGENLLTFKKPSQGRILVGEEGPGLPAFQRVQWVSIPTENVESLNATVAASLMIWHLMK